MQKLRNSLAFRASWSRLRAKQSKHFVLLVVICCFTIAILGSAQVSWIGRVNRAEHERTMAALQDSLVVLTRSLSREVLHLLTVFRADPRWSPAERAQRLSERYFVWHESSDHGPAIERILFYDASSLAASRLRELKPPQQRLEAIGSAQDYKDLGARLRSTSSRHRRMMGPQWLSTWLYYPDFSALVRPVGTLRQAPSNGGPEMFFAGYLVLLLDHEYISRRILPDFLRDHLLSLRGDLQVDVAFVVDGQVTHFFSEVDGSDRATENNASFPDTYALAADSNRLGTDWVESADARHQVFLMMNPVRAPLGRVGAVQRIALRPLIDDSNSREFARNRLPPNRVRASEMPVVRLRPERPRLFLAAGRQRRLEVVVKHVNGSLEGALAAQHSRSLALGAGLILLLGGAMALVVVSLRRASKLVNMRLEFATAVSHELRTPVTAIRAMGDNMAEGVLGTSEKALSYGRLIRDEGRRLSEMIEQTLKLASLDSGSERYDVVPIDIAAVVDEAVEHARPIIDGSGFVLERSDVDDIPRVLADETALKQSLANLLSNAVKYGLPGRWVKLEVVATDRGEKPEVEISVHDHGPGIPAKEQRSIFEPYYRALGANDSTVPGSGLGLNLAKRMVHGMGGRLTLLSAPGQGSVFTIHLPVAV